MRKIISRRPSGDLDALSFPADMPAVIQRIYAARGIRTAQELDYRLQHLSRPTRLRGLPDALALLEQTLRQEALITIIGDFDADGATSTALAVECLQALGHARVNYLVPNRFEYGYGLTPEIVAVAARQSPGLIITVDNGISSLEGVAAAQAAGIKVLITDHHLPGEQLPQADAIVNPNQPGCEFPSKHLAGVGVIFYLMSALRGHLREHGWFEGDRVEPNMGQFLDLVALGTVADVVPLDYNNRILVAQGLERMRAGKLRPGIRALLDVAGRSLRQLTSSDLGFAVGPRLNAAGRLDDMSLGIRCLMAQNDAEAFGLARELNDLNSDRKQIEASMQAEALRVLEQLKITTEADLPTGLVLYQPGWHQGVIGIVASRLKDRLHRPVLVLADSDQPGQLKGSGRSVPGIHMRDTLDLIAAQHPEILSKFGGHAMAAGLTLAREDLQTFSRLFDEAVTRQLGEKGLEARLLTDGSLTAEDYNLELARELRRCGPWGQAFPEPLFDGEFRILRQRVLGGKHLKLSLQLPEQPLELEAIAFNADLSQWPGEAARRLRAAFKLDINNYRGQETLQLIIDYFELVEEAEEPVGNAAESMTDIPVN